MQRYATPRPLGKGAELGTFHLGSTVILLFEPGKVTLSGLERGRAVRVAHLMMGGADQGDVVGLTGHVR